MKKKICILGAGSWGVTLADLLFHNGHSVSIWEFFEIQAKQLALKRKLPTIPNIKLSDKITVSHDMKQCCTSADIVIFAVPSEYMRSTVTLFAESTKSNTSIEYAISVTKGIENKTFLRMSEVICTIASFLTNRIISLSGPSHAEEVSKRIPTAVVAASQDISLSEKTRSLFMNDYFRVYTNTDIMGVELGGAVKNILAIGCGICDGLGLGDNTKAALMTRGMAEMVRLGVVLGAKPETFSGLSGIGDLIVTCTSHYSRNRLFGEKIGKGLTMKEALKEMVMVAEGVPTAKAVFELTQKLSINMPITEQVYAVLYKQKDPKKAIIDLMTRKAKPE